MLVDALLGMRMTQPRLGRHRFGGVHRQDARPSEPARQRSGEHAGPGADLRDGGGRTCQLGVFAAERGQVGRTGSLLNIKGWGLREWFILTYVMGAVFIGGQALEYAELIHEGLTIPSDAYGTVFYLTTGFHGLHVTGGLIAFLFVLGRTYLARRFTHEQAVSAIVVSYYWHFVDVVWIALFFIIYFLK